MEIYINSHFSEKSGRDTFYCVDLLQPSQLIGSRRSRTRRSLSSTQTGCAVFGRRNLRPLVATIGVTLQIATAFINKKKNAFNSAERKSEAVGKCSSDFPALALVIFRRAYIMQGRAVRVRKGRLLKHRGSSYSSRHNQIT